MTSPPERIAARMRRTREDLGISQEEVARRLGATSRTYARWERIETFGYLQRLPEIAKALETTESELLGEENLLTPSPTVDELAAKLDEVADELRRLREDLRPIVANFVSL